MDSYNFTYKDVLKRHERIINRVEKWEIHALAIIMLLVTFFFVFTSGVFASEDSLQDNREQVYFEVLQNRILSGAHAIIENEGFNLYYLELEQGYTYYISLNYVTDSRIGYTNSLTLGSNVYNFTYFSNDGHINMTIDADSTNYLFFDYSSSSSPEYTIYREPTSALNNVVTDLVDNVGINQIWDIFGSGVDFVYVVILVAFGIFLVAFAIRKISKGKSEI